ncbi:proliferating cell nuclear antigen (pcna) [Candidatus Pacearchaeota archaeon]|nr:proliferating cell nuclear antigen (pcna) [Candidatus Pacearchaeota archaeon]
MKIKLENPATLARAIELISELVQEVRLKFSDFGMSITAMDPANVSMVNFRIPKSAFSEFEADKETLGINLDNLKRILKRAGAGSAITISRKDGILEITIDDRIRRNFSMGLINIESEEIDFQSKLANMEFSSEVEINSIDWIASIEDCSVVSDSCAFKIEDGKFIIESKGINSARSEFSDDEASISGEECRAKYSLEYLSKFLKGAKLTEKTKMKFAQDHPLKLDFKAEHMEISFVLAPRVETED